jgi:hypothetical protein
MNRLRHFLDRHLPSFDASLTLALIVWGLICLGLLGGAIVYLP